jgi:hypothetical protein
VVRDGCIVALRIADRQPKWEDVGLHRLGEAPRVAGRSPETGPWRGVPDAEPPHGDWVVTAEDVAQWYKAHRGTLPGVDVAPIILNERLAAAADRVRAAYSDVPEVLIQDQLRELWESRLTSSWRKSMVDGLVERIAAYLPLPMGETSAVPDARLLPRRPGRPAWTRQLFLERWQEAARIAAADPDGSMRRLGHDPSNADIAVVFRSLDGTQGMTPESLRRLRRRFMRTTAK